MPKYIRILHQGLPSNNKLTIVGKYNTEKEVREDYKRLKKLYSTESFSVYKITGKFYKPPTFKH